MPSSLRTCTRLWSGMPVLHSPHQHWAAWYVTRLLVELSPKGVVFSFLQHQLPSNWGAVAALTVYTGHVEHWFIVSVCLSCIQHQLPSDWGADCCLDCVQWPCKAWFIVSGTPALHSAAPDTFQLGRCCCLDCVHWPCRSLIQCEG